MENTLTVEPSREPQRMAHTWILPPGMAQRQALEFFESTVKPSGYTFEKWKYNRQTGMMVTA